ncbi:hypothetical protein BDW72DRAFT_68152 [Aspergillus terricola var. indicus]
MSNFSLLSETVLGAHSALYQYPMNKPLIKWTIRDWHIFSNEAVYLARLQHSINELKWTASSSVSHIARLVYSTNASKKPSNDISLSLAS